MADKCKICFVCEEEKKEEPKPEKPPAFLAAVVAAILDAAAEWDGPTTGPVAVGALYLG